MENEKARFDCVHCRDTGIIPEAHYTSSTDYEGYKQSSYILTGKICPKCHGANQMIKVL